MQIFGCGSLNASQKYIPTGETRQYSLIEIDRSLSKLTYHIRKTLEQPLRLPIWMAGNISQNNNNSYLEVHFKIPISHERKDANMTSKSEMLKKLAEADDLVIIKDYHNALQRLKELDPNDPFVRRLTIECLSQLEMDDECIKFIKKPKNITEFTLLSEALWRKKEYHNLRKLLKEFSQNSDYSTSEAFKRMKRKLNDRGE